MRHAILLPFLALTACVDTLGAGLGGGRSVAAAPDPIPAGTVRVAQVAVRLPEITVTMSDGARCTGVRPEGEVSNWSGVTGDCPYRIPYVVTFARGGDPSRFVVERPGGAMAADGTPGPRAEVFVTDTDGVRRLFVVPLPDRVFGVAPTG